jgi:chemotaxis protein MotB
MARKKAGAHHGGAWKVAYADFVTAMMALFMVLWISSQDKKILIATSRYFQSPFNSPMKNTSGILPFDTNKPTKPKGDDSGSDSKSSNASEIDLQFLNSVAKDFYRLMNVSEDLNEKPVDIQVTSDGLRVILYDRSRKPLFVGDTSEFTEWGRFAMQSLAWMIDRNRFNVVIEGHTREGQVLNKPEYGPWELSADRANAARRSLVYYAVDEKLIARVTGYAATRPVPFQEPTNETNERITLSLTKVNQPKVKQKLAPTPKSTEASLSGSVSPAGVDSKPKASASVEITQKTAHTP